MIQKLKTALRRVKDIKIQNQHALQTNKYQSFEDVSQNFISHMALAKMSQKVRRHLTGKSLILWVNPIYAEIILEKEISPRQHVSFFLRVTVMLPYIELNPIWNFQIKLSLFLSHVTMICPLDGNSQRRPPCASSWS